MRHPFAVFTIFFAVMTLGLHPALPAIASESIAAYETTPYLSPGTVHGDFTSEVTYYYLLNTSLDSVYRVELKLFNNPYATLKAMDLQNQTIFHYAPAEDTISYTFRDYNETLVLVVDGFAAQGSFDLTLSVYPSDSVYFPSRTYSDALTSGRPYRYNVTEVSNQSGYMSPDIHVNDSFVLEAPNDLRQLGWEDSLSSIFTLTGPSNLLAGDGDINLFVSPLSFIAEEYYYGDVGTYLLNYYTYFLNRSALVDLTDLSTKHRANFIVGDNMQLYVRWDSYGFQELTVEFDMMTGLMENFYLELGSSVLAIELIKDVTLTDLIENVSFSTALNTDDSFVWEITNFQTDGSIIYYGYTFDVGTLMYLNVTNEKRTFNLPSEEFMIDETFEIKYGDGKLNPFTYSHFITPVAANTSSGALEVNETVFYFNEYYFRNFDHPVESVVVTSTEVTAVFVDFSIRSEVTFDLYTGIMTKMHLSAIRPENLFELDLSLKTALPTRPVTTTEPSSSTETTTQTTTQTTTSATTSGDSDLTSSSSTNSTNSPSSEDSVAPPSPLPLELTPVLFAMSTVVYFMRRRKQVVHY